MKVDDKFGPILIDYYLPEHIRDHMRMLGVSKEKTEEMVKYIMSDSEKKANYMKVIEELAKEDA
ncbi:hypothetical protein [Paenibacillus alkalitolerans]|uniref:hypothetical protein n=1 Tax=Paenibacillus alkalitolerans TaxID=2799335 RepID=UPI0018F46DB3|nr:hypothetical protein [Paenibacillus alkalitolerans]